MTLIDFLSDSKFGTGSKVRPRDPSAEGDRKRPLAKTKLGFLAKLDLTKNPRPP